MPKPGRQPDNPILIVDDETHALKSFELTLRSAGLNHIIQCPCSRDVDRILAENEIEMMLLDILMPELSGEAILAHVTTQYPHIPVIMVTGLNEVETAVRCIRNGAFDYILKPVERERLIAGVQKAIELRRLRRENAVLTRHFFSQTIEQPDKFARIITRNKKMQAIFHYCEAVGPGSRPILITGETGVGKELIAEAIHGISGRSNPMVAVNAAGLDDNVFSDTLFGHIKGAFTDAAGIRSGYIEKAAGGTLFLDEIGDLSMTSQVKLLRLLDRHEYVPLGSDTARTTDARFIFATHRDLPELVRNGQFRNDLFFRLRTHLIHIPPLRERLDDLPILLTHFIAAAAAEFKKAPPEPAPSLLPYLAEYDFPGNIRELKSMIFDAVGRNQKKQLSVPLFSRTIDENRKTIARVPRRPPAASDSGMSWMARWSRMPTLKELTAEAVAEALRRTNNNQRQAARLLGMTPQALNQRLKRQPNPGAGTKAGTKNDVPFS